MEIERKFSEQNEGNYCQNNHHHEEVVVYAMNASARQYIWALADSWHTSTIVVKYVFAGFCCDPTDDQLTSMASQSIPSRKPSKHQTRRSMSSAPKSTAPFASRNVLGTSGREGGFSSVLEVVFLIFLTRCTGTLLRCWYYPSLH